MFQSIDLGESRLGPRVRRLSTKDADELQVQRSPAGAVLEPLATPASPPATYRQDDETLAIGA